MYNRYIPQDDGSYTRNRMQDKAPQPQHRPPTPTPDIPQNTVQTLDSPHREEAKIPHKNGGFLKQLLPKGFDTGDLIVILLLLLMAGDCEEDRNNAILTIALYFLM